MVQFRENGFTIDVHTGTLPHDNYEMTINDIISALQSVSSDMRGEDNYFYLLELLRAMLPNEEQIKKMIA